MRDEEKGADERVVEVDEAGMLSFRGARGET